MVRKKREGQYRDINREEKKKKQERKAYNRQEEKKGWDVKGKEKK